MDFYDSGLIYDFERDVITICDIDLFRKKPAYNEIGADYYGKDAMQSVHFAQKVLHSGEKES